MIKDQEFREYSDQDLEISDEQTDAQKALEKLINIEKDR